MGGIHFKVHVEWEVTSRQSSNIGAKSHVTEVNNVSGSIKPDPMYREGPLVD